MGSRMEDNKGLGPSTTHVDLAVSTQDTAVGLDSDELLVPRRCTLDGFAEEAARQGGVDMGEFPTLTRLHVRTQNTVYQLILLSPGESKVLIQGGAFFRRANRVLPLRIELWGQPSQSLLGRFGNADRSDARRASYRNVYRSVGSCGGRLRHLRSILSPFSYLARSPRTVSSQPRK